MRHIEDLTFDEMENLIETNEAFRRLVEDEYRAEAESYLLGDVLCGLKVDFAYDEFFEKFVFQIRESDDFVKIADWIVSEQQKCGFFALHIDNEIITPFLKLVEKCEEEGSLSEHFKKLRWYTDQLEKEIGIFLSDANWPQKESLADCAFDFFEGWIVSGNDVFKPSSKKCVVIDGEVYEAVS